MNSKEQILNALNALAGTWNSSGSMLAGEDSIEVKGTDAYEWLPGKQFMIHKADVMVGSDKVDVIEIIGEYDETKKACAMHAFQNDGSHGLMWASVNEDGSFLFAGDAIRATLTVNPDGKTMDAKWERLDNTTWTHWMDMHFTKP
jgi:hypothetical protein